MSQLINSITINNQNVTNFKYGLTISDVLSKELDTGVLVLPQVSKLDIEPFDTVVITYETTKILRMVVAQINAKIVNHEGAKKYVYTLGLASQTLRLQRIVLPARSITNSLDGSSDKTILKVIQEYLEIYAPSITNISAALQAKTASVTCPEFSWTRPTLFEVFNDLLGVIGCVVTITGSNTLDILDLYDKGDAINETLLSNFETERNIADYASAVEIQASNVYDVNTSSTSEFVTVRTTQGALLTTTNQEIVLQKPIFQIKKVTARFIYDLGGSTVPVVLDITNRVVEQTVYDTFYNSNLDGFRGDTAERKLRRNYITFKQGSNVITGLNLKENTQFPFFQSYTAINNVIRWALFDTNQLTASYNDQYFESFLDERLLLLVEYIPDDNVTFRVIKETATRNPSVLINGQTSAEVYARSLGRQQQEFVNRIGNEEMIITGRYNAYNDIPKLNDFIDEFILTSREIVFNANFYNFKGVLSKHYAKDNMFAGIDTSRRYTEIALPSKALISNHVSGNVFVLSTSNGAVNTTGINNYLLQFGKAGEKIQGAIVRTIPTQVTTHPFNHPLTPFFSMEGTSHLVGNSIIYNLRMSDNANVGLAIETEVIFLSTGVKSMIKNTYVNNLGRFYAIAVRLYKQGGIVNLGLDNLAFEIPNTQVGRDNLKSATLIAAKLPVISPTETYETPGGTVTYNRIDDTKQVYGFLNTGPFNISGLLDFKKRYKDNREITSETIQFHFRKSANAFFTERFLELSPFIYNGTTDLPLFIGFSLTKTYTDNDVLFNDSLVNNNGNMIVTISGNQIYLEPTTAGATFWANNSTLVTSWAICDVDGKIIVARNGNLTQRLFLNSTVIV